jgi:hypothetical protein
VQPILPPSALPLRLEGIATAGGRRSVVVDVHGAASVVRTPDPDLADGG